MKKSESFVLGTLDSVESLLFSLAHRKERQAEAIGDDPRYGVPHFKRDRRRLQELKQDSATLISASAALSSISDLLEDLLTAPRPAQPQPQAPKRNGAPAESATPATLSL
jgi:hypothetical protein